MTRVAPLALVAVLAACSVPSRAPEPLAMQTTAERSGFTQTTLAADVGAFLRASDAVSTRLHLTSFGTSGEGRDLPLAVWNAAAATPDAVRATGKTRVLVLANIHGGEVAGKEAALTLVRDLALGQTTGLDSLVVLVAPLYNADGNDAIALDNRRLQLGPVGGMGQRSNADGLDLNRDLMKAAAPETRALLGLFDTYDPHVVLDLHTTDGTPMAYGLTYAPGLSPNTPPALDALARDVLLPRVTASLERDFDLLTYHYGNVPGAFGEPATAPRGWYSFSPDPRFLTNYVGLRGRLAILSEAYSYSTFEERVRDTRRFVDAVLREVATHAADIRDAVDAADRAVRPGDTLALRGDYAALPEPVEIQLGRVDTVAHPVTGAPMRRRTGEREPETMPAFVAFRASERERVPTAYFVRATDAVLATLDAHGADVVIAPVPAAHERFRADSVRVSDRPFQGVRMRTADGAWVPATEPPPGRWARVEPVGPLARVVFMLLEPRSTDGMVAWAIAGPDDVLRVP